MRSCSTTDGAERVSAESGAILVHLAEDVVIADEALVLAVRRGRARGRAQLDPLVDRRQVIRARALLDARRHEVYAGRFVLDADGSYADLDGARGGSWSHDTTAATISFSGGYLDGQQGKGVSAEGFALTDTVSCEPYR